MGPAIGRSADMYREGTRIAVIALAVAFTITLLPGAVAAGPKAKADQASQTIEFELPRTGTVGESLKLEAIASSGLPIEYRAKPKKRCSVEGTVLHLEGEGTCRVEATQAGGDVYATAAEVSASIEVMAQSEQAPAPKAEPEPKIEAEPKPKAEPEAKAQPKSKTEPKTKPSKVKTAPKAKRDTEVRIEPALPAEPGRLVAPATSPILALACPWNLEGDVGTKQFDVQATLTPMSAEAVKFTYVTRDDTATTKDNDYVAVPGATATISAGSPDVWVHVDVNGDTTVEPDEYFEVGITNISGATWNEKWRKCEIRNDDLPPPALSVTGYSVNEPTGHDTTASFDVWLVPAATQTVTVHYATTDGTATAGLDYVAVSGDLVFTTGESVKLVRPTVKGDALIEPDETFSLVLSDPVNATIASGSASATIVDNDVALTINRPKPFEGDSGDTPLWFSASLAQAVTHEVTFEYTTQFGTATEGTDYAGVESLPVAIPAGGTSAQFAISVHGDSDIEPDETIHVWIEGLRGATFGQNPAVGTILNDDGPGISVADTTVSEGGGSAVFTVSLDEVGTEPVTVQYHTSNQLAIAGVDYAARSGSLTIPSGETSKSVGIPVIDDTLDEPDEGFALALSDPVGGHIVDGYGTATIIDDDNPAISVADSRIPEDASGVVVEISLATAGVEPVSVHYATADGTATAGSDYTAVDGDVTFHPGLRYRYVTIPTIDDTLDEPDETFTLVLSDPVGGYIADGSGSTTIVDDDIAALSVSDVTVSEGSGSDPVATFAVSLSPPSSLGVTVSWATADGSALAGSDYITANGYLSFGPGDPPKSVEVTVAGDTLDEPNETFRLVLSNPTNAVLADGSGTATIIDDDPAPPLGDTTAPTVSAPRVDIAKLGIKKASRPIPLKVSFSATDPSGIADTTLQHRIGSDAFADVPLASARAVRATVRVSKNNKTVHRFRSQARDAATPSNTSPFKTAPAFKVRVRQDGTRAVKQQGVWSRKRSPAFFGGSIRATTRKGALQKLTAVGSDFAIVSTKGRNRGKAKVLIDGRRVATIDLYAWKTKPRRIVFAKSFGSVGKHTIVFKATGTKNRKSKGKRVDLDAFVVLTRP